MGHAAVFHSSMTCFRGCTDTPSILNLHIFRMSRPAADEGRLVYVGNLPDEVRERDLGDLFDKYGKIFHIEIKVPPRPPNFAFIEYGDWRCVPVSLDLLSARKSSHVHATNEQREHESLIGLMYMLYSLYYIKKDLIAF